MRNTGLPHSYQCYILAASRVIINVQVGIVLIIAVERFLVVVYPLKNFLTNRFVIILELLNILIALAVTLPVVIVAKLETIMGQAICVADWPRRKTDSRVYQWINVCLYLALPVVFLIPLFLVMGLTLRSQAKRVESHVNKVQAEKRAKENRRIIFILFLILLFFICLTALWRLGYLPLDYDTSLISPSSFMYMMTIFNLHLIVNPIIYWMADATWRRDAKKFLTCCKVASAPKNEAISSTLPGVNGFN